MRRPGLGFLLAAVGCVQGGDRMVTSAATLGEGTASGESGEGTGPSTTSGDDGPDDGVDSESTGGAGESTGVAPDEPPDLSLGTWEFTNISQTEGISLHPRRAVLDDGREFVAWGQADPNNLSNINILTAEGPEAWTPATITAFPDVQNTYPFFAGGSRALLVWSGRVSPDDTHDIFIVRSQGSAWSPPENISSAFEDAAEPLQDTEPVVLRRSDGGVAVAYFASLDFISNPDVFVSKFFEDNSPSQRETLATAAATSCAAIAGAVAPSDVFHFVLQCSKDGMTSLIHGSDRSGDWDTDDLAGVTSGVLSPNMAAGPEGVHLVWIQNVPCGADDCSEVFHMATDSEEVFGTAVQVTNSANLNERMPAVGVDRWGRVLVLAQARVDNEARLYLSVAEDGETFADPDRISPDGADDYQTPHGVAFDAAGNPSFVLEVVVDGTDPLNVEIMMGRFVPE